MKNAKGKAVNDKLVIHSVSKCPVGICQVDVTEPDIGCALSFLKLWEETKQESSSDLGLLGSAEGL